MHRPPLGALKTFQPMVSVGAGADPPDGTHQYTMPQPVTGVNADFQGTYTVYLVNSSFSGSASTARTITVTVTQFEFAGGPGYSVSTLPISVAPNQVNNGIVTAGVLTLPVKAVAPDNVGGYYTVSVTDSPTPQTGSSTASSSTPRGRRSSSTSRSADTSTITLDAPDPNVSLGRDHGQPERAARTRSASWTTPRTSPAARSSSSPPTGTACCSAIPPTAPRRMSSLSYFAAYYFDRT